MSDRHGFRWATTSARLLAGTLASVGAVALVVTAISLPWPTLQRTPATVEALPGPAATTVACVGDLLVQGRDLQNPGDLISASGQTVTAGVLAGAPEPVVAQLSIPDTAVSGPVAFTVQPQDGARTDLAAAGSATVSDDDLSGYAASACRPPLIESWLVGGSGATGAGDLVLLSNPGTVVATVQVTVYGATGPQSPTGGTDVIVPALSQRVLPLAGLALGEQSPVLRITSSGAPVQAALQSSITRTLLPGGVDQSGALPGPDPVQIIAGVAVSEDPGAEGASGAATVLRVLSPGVDATATVTVRPVGGRTPALSPTTVPLVAGMPTEVELGGLPVGRYVVDVEADSPVVAGVWQTTGFGEGVDFAWYMPSPIVDSPSLFAVPSGVGTVVTVVNPSDAVVDAVFRAEDGSTAAQLSIPAGSSADVSVPGGRILQLDTGGAAVRAAVSQTGDGALAGYPVWPVDAAASPITVYP